MPVLVVLVLVLVLVVLVSVVVLMPLLLLLSLLLLLPLLPSRALHYQNSRMNVDSPACLASWISRRPRPTFSSSI